MLLGRAADPLRCDDAREATRTLATCERSVVVGEAGHGLQIGRAYGPTQPPIAGASPCGRAGVLLCGQAVDGPYGSYALTCRDTNDQPSGAVRLVAPDGSVLAEGACDRGRAVGTWFSWSAGHLAAAVTIADGQPLGLRVFWSDGAYGHDVDGRGK